MTGVAECVWQVGAELGEGPVWSAAEQAVWFVDIKGRHIHRFHPATGERRTWDAPDQPGFLAPLADGTFVVGLKTGLHRFNPATGGFTILAPIDRPEVDNRLNDGFVDAQGRLWFGSMHDPEAEPTGALHRLQANGEVVRVDEGYCITNGPAMSPDGRILYHIDTRKRVVYAYDVDPAGELSNRRDFVRIERHGAHPDGPVVDAEGCIWVALFGGWGLDRYSPAGELVGRIELPCANVTKGAFGGDDLRTLYVTTAWKSLSDEDRAAQPLAGGLFKVRMDVPGLPQNLLRVGV